ncbi:probable helicase senataxin isoform X2 [Leptopilina boulardi]|uniref:probable helicase senataxin isoform X2 n=1 Tax=Leptopilina boulardi TaxID=63433 RepID=UPI0021F56126|nr:probable helicase senataxin isoform X2 [Leptopilina boulardi]
MVVNYILQRINSDQRVFLNNSDVSYTCGRGRENQIICPSMFVSRNHCIFIIQSDGLYIRDLNSSNGVYVNGDKKITNTLLKQNDKIGIGVPEQDPHENNYYVYSLYINEVENFDINNADAAASGSSNQVEIKTEPEESDEKDVNKKRPSEDKEGNASKKQKTNEEHGEDPLPSTSSANVDSVRINSIKLEAEDEIEIVNVIVHANDNKELATKKNWKPAENIKSKTKSNITNIEKISRDKALDVDFLKKNITVNKDLNATVKHSPHLKHNQEKNPSKQHVQDSVVNKNEQELILKNNKKRKMTDIFVPNRSKDSFQTSSNSYQYKNCDKLVSPSTSSDKMITSIKMEEVEEDVVFLDAEENNITPNTSNVPVKQPQNQQISTSKLVKLKTVKKGPTTCYSQNDIVCLSSDDEDDERCIFPCSQLFNDEPVIKSEIKMEENEINESHDDKDVIILSDSDDEIYNPWFDKLYNSQVYRPSQEIKNKSDNKNEKTNEDGLESLFSKYEEKNQYKSELEFLQENKILEIEEQDDDVWDESIQSQQTASQEAENKIVTEQIDNRKSLSKYDTEKSQKNEKIYNEDEFLDVEADINSLLDISSLKYKNRREKEKEDENLQKEKKSISHREKEYQETERRKDSRDEKYKKRRKSSSDDSERSIDERKHSKISSTEKKDNLKNNLERRKIFDQEKYSIDERKRNTSEDRKIKKSSEYFEKRKNDQERRKTVDQERSSIDERKRNTSEDRKLKKSSEYFENRKNDQERRKTVDKKRHSIDERKRRSTSEDRKIKKSYDHFESRKNNHERRKSIDQERLSIDERQRRSISEDRKGKKLSEYFENGNNNQEKRKTIHQESLKDSIDDSKQRSVSEDRKINHESSRHYVDERKSSSMDRRIKKLSELFGNQEKKKKNWDEALTNIEEKGMSVKATIKQPIRKAIVIDAPYMTKSEKRGINLTVSRDNNNSNEKKEESENEFSKVASPRIRSRSRNRKSQENIFEERNKANSMNNKERIKEKLKELAAKRSLCESNSNIVPVRKSKGIAKITHKSRQDSFVCEQQKATLIKPVIARERKKSSSPVAHCSKFSPESKEIQIDKNSFNKREEKRPILENKSNDIFEKDNNNKRQQEELFISVNLNQNQVPLKSIEEKKVNRNSLKSCLPLFSDNIVKKKKKVRFSEKIDTRIFEIDPRNSLSRFVGKDAPINRKKSQIEPKIDEYLSRIFEWNPVWLGEQKKLAHEPPVYGRHHLSKIQTHYSSFMEYSNVFRPLLLLEIWNSLSRESECDEKKSKFRLHYCSVVQNSVSKMKTFMGDYQTNLLIEILMSKEDFDKELYPGPGHLLIFELPFYKQETDKNGSLTKKLQFHSIFAYVKSKTNTEIKPNTRFNKKLIEFTPNSEILVTLCVLAKNGIEPVTDHVCRIRGAMYLKSNMRDILALQNLPNSNLEPLILSPKLKDYILPEPQQTPLVSKEDLNERQIEAVMRISEAALTEKPLISLIHGPPGTGKSKVIVNIVIQILFKNPNAQILVCAPSNAAVDELALRLSQIRSNLEFKNIKMVRVGRTEAMNSKVKNISLAELGRKHVEKDFCLNKNEQKTRKENDAEMRKLESLLNLVEERIENIKRNGVKGDLSQLYRQRQNFQNNIKTFKAKIDQRVDFKTLTQIERNKINREMEELVLSKATVIACTLSYCYSGIMEKIFGGKDKIKIPICIVDEATQCSEPENLIPLMLGVKKLILVGDTNQLPATIISKKAKEMGLDQSLFSRIQKTFENYGEENPIIMLNMQYRMDYPILSWPNSYFYQGKLIDKANVKTVPYSSYRVLNLNSLQDENKFANTDEAEFVSKVIYIMITSVDVYSFKDTLQIGVITPYQNQRNVVLSKIDTLLKTVSSNRRSKFLIDVNTVDSFQGQEKDVIVMSCVRSNGIGFMSDRQRLCVALTRAKSSLILCGNFKTFQKDEMWNELITDAKSRGILIDVNVNASMKEIKSHVLR